MRMDEGRVPKRMLFVWLPQQRPTHGTKNRWRERARKDLKKFDIEEGSWYKLAQERESWRRSCRTGLEDAKKKRLQVDELRKRTKTAELSNEASGQFGKAIALHFKCDTCQHPFRSVSYTHLTLPTKRIV